MTEWNQDTYKFEMPAFTTPSTRRLWPCPDCLGGRNPNRGATSPKLLN